MSELEYEGTQADRQDIIGDIKRKKEQSLRDYMEACGS